MKYLIDYSVKNLTRNKRRTILTLLAIGVAVFFMNIGNSYFSGIFSDVIADSVRENGHIILQKKSFTKKERMVPLDESISNPEEIINEIIKDKNVIFASPRINIGGFFSKNNESIASFGIALDVDKEKETIRLANNIVQGQYFIGNGKEIIIGTEIAKILGIKNSGEVLTLLTRDINGAFTGGKFTVTGIVDMGTPLGNKNFYISLANAYKMLKNEDQPQKIIVVLKNYNKLKSVKNSLIKNKIIIDNDLDVLAVDEIGVFKSIFSILLFLVPLIFIFFGLIALLTIANTMMMTVLERKSEIGVLQALGVKSKLVAQSFIFESLTIGIIGSSMGGGVAAILIYILSKIGIQFGTKIANGMPIPMKAVIYPLFSPVLILEIVLLGIFISLIAGVIPALRSLKLKPAEAIRG